MRILGLLRADESSERGDPPSPELIQKMGDLVEELTRAGVLLATDGLKPSSEGKRVSLSAGKVSVIDGPFTESKELIASYALLQVKDWDEALKWNTRFLEVLGEGQVELRPVYELTDFPQESLSPEEAARETRVREQMERNAARS